MFEPTAVSPADLTLPICPLPRPGEEVIWFVKSNPMSGTFLGHDTRGFAIISTAFGHSVAKRFDEIRLTKPFDRRGPIWCYLPTAAKLFRPNSALTRHFEALLNQRIPPGPRCLDLIREIYSRGFEVFLVGGTVRDAIAGLTAKDIDLVTTMPLNLASRFIRPMYRSSPSMSKNNGFIRIGGSPVSGNPFIDVKVFSNSFAGKRDALFGTGFERDVCHRDFAMNALYYDPMNNVIFDPTGRGVADATNKVLCFICETAQVFQHAQIFIRAVKFVARGFAPTPETLAKLQGDLAEALFSMQLQVKEGYLKTQLFSKCTSPSEYPATLATFQSAMDALDLSLVWKRHFEPMMSRLIK